jgi:hypothetical protein
MTTKHFNVTSEEDLRDLFWEDHPQFAAERDEQKSQNAYRCDIRVAFVEYVDRLARAGDISDELASQATL